MRMPAQLIERARAIVYGGDWTPPPTRPASTLVLLRDGDGIEVALLQRATTLAFAKDMYVFPGGALDPADSDLGDPWLVAAIRETFEECGVLLTRPDPPGTVRELRDRDFAHMLATWGGVPDLAALHPFDHWVTPEVETRRYDPVSTPPPCPLDRTAPASRPSIRMWAGTPRPAPRICPCCPRRPPSWPSWRGSTQLPKCSPCAAIRCR